ncbi:hypothetical protein B0537_08825 [Desulforamulus ferrireducens]|uniref:Uncharacterized protein n=1 Tax=Desulforamulus ferrireducens TaxID=1833852 RepID=A0A1S6IWM6_9FIRM|nr:hypothetical protein B0537_08825 [Desulforamulus ferrireducens]
MAVRPLVPLTSLTEGGVGGADGGSWTQKQLPQSLRASPLTEGAQINSFPWECLQVPGIIQKADSRWLRANGQKSKCRITV